MSSSDENQGRPLLDGRTVSRRLKLRAGTLDELVSSGKVEAFDGRYDVEQVRRAVGGAFEETTLEQLTSEDAQTRAVALATQLADKTMGRESRMFDLYASHLQKLVDALQKENAALRDEKAELRAENSKLHNQLLEGFKAKESLLSKQHERDMLQRMLETKTATQREGLALVKQVLPLVRQHFVAQAGNSVARQLFESIEPAQLEAILAIDFLTEEQKALLAKITSPTPTPKTTNGATAPGATHQ